MSRGSVAVAAVLIPLGSACGLLLDLDPPGSDGGAPPGGDAAVEGGAMDGALPFDGAMPSDGAPPSDGAMPFDAGGPCTPSSELCNGLDDNCDGLIDEGFDLRTDVRHCGACGNGCALPGATAGCSGGVCTVAGCDPGLGDCDGRPVNGCEVDLETDAAHCGFCTVSCRSGATCSGGTCVGGGPLCTVFEDWGCISTTTYECQGRCGAVDLFCSGGVCGCGVTGCASPPSSVTACDRCRFALASGCCP